MAGFLIIIGLSLLFLIFLIAESTVHNRRLKRIPLRITVSGTRGKTSIVRTLASVLRAHGIRVLAKTTGSEAMYILPDSSTERINRKGLTTILEQKHLISKAVQLEAECIIAEIMSIHPANHTIETHKLIKPGITVLSNFRADHTDVAGVSLLEISELYINDIYRGSRVIIPEGEINEFILKGIQQESAVLINAIGAISDELRLDPSQYHQQFRTNLDIVVTAARYLGIPDHTIKTGIGKTQLDIGQLEIFRFREDGRKIWFVNAFAANDPYSTIQIMGKTREILANEMTGDTGIIGLLALRPDRGERSRQWLDHLKSDGKDLFGRIYASGIHSAIFARELSNCEMLTSKDPEKIIRQIIDSTRGDILVFGIANIHGSGLKLLEYWKSL